MCRQYLTDGSTANVWSTLQLDKHSDEMLVFFACAPVSRLHRPDVVMNRPVYRCYLGRLRADGRYYLERWRVKIDVEGIWWMPVFHVCRKVSGFCYLEQFCAALHQIRICCLICEGTTYIRSAAPQLCPYMHYLCMCICSCVCALSAPRVYPLMGLLCGSFGKPSARFRSARFRSVRSARHYIARVM